MNKTEYLLVCLMEEAAEVQKAAAKALRFGMQNYHPDRPECTNASELSAECGDLVGVIGMLFGNNGGLSSGIYNLARMGKAEKLSHYMDVSRQCGTLD